MNDISPELPQSPPPPSYMPAGEKPNNHLVMAILATICCCLPTGIPAIVFAAQVDGKWASGDSEGARDYSEKAKLWGLVSIGLGVVGTLAIVALELLGAALSA